VSYVSWKSVRLVVALAAVLSLLASYSSVGRRLEGLLLDWGSYLIPQTDRTESVAVVAIDAATLEELGPRPLGRDRLAEVVRKLKRFDVKTVGFMLPLTQAETPAAVGSVGAELDALDASLRKKAKAWLASFDTDSQLRQAFNDMGKVVLAVPGVSSGETTTLPRELKRFTIDADRAAAPWHRTVLQRLLSAPLTAQIALHPPASGFVDSVTSIGASAATGAGSTVRGSALVTEAGGRYLPGFELSLLAVARGLHSDALRVIAGGVAAANDNNTLASPDLHYYPRPAAAAPVYSLSDVLASDQLAGSLSNRVVLLGTTATGFAPELRGPGGRSYSPVTWSAQVLQSMLNGHAFDVPHWFYGIQRALLTLFALYFVLVPASWHGLAGVVASGLLAALLLNAGLVTLLVKGLWLPVVGPSLFLIATQLLLALAWRARKRLITAQQAAIEARVALGTNLQSQGQLDLAMHQFLQCLPAPVVLQPLYELGLEYERHRQINKAQTIYAHLERFTKGFRDSTQRLDQLSDLSVRFPNTATSEGCKTLVLDAPVMELPVLGRYRLERELGRGAMGTVYLATDPTIGRSVAIKTLPLMQTYDEPEQEAAAGRFFKEAEAVGRLDHANIVTVYDAGREHDLAYIAMDYVSGQSLDAWTAKPDLLPVWEVLEIATQVAEALYYAHGRNIVHRDIKPGNIIYDRDSGTVKITDFGVARIVDASQTRTGSVLGTPCYMSPEQVAGKKMDGRSDLFSLGTTLYQMLSGSLPFNADSVAALMYQITNHKTPAMSRLRPGLPVCVNRLLTKAMQKDPAKRFANGQVMAAAIRKCRAQFKSGRRMTA
jgi:serine/threonine-protein kinase